MKSSTGNKIPEHAAPRLPVFYQPLWPNLHCTINSEFNITSFTSVFSVQCSLFGVYNPPIKSAILLSVEKSLAIAILLWNAPKFEYEEPIELPVVETYRKRSPVYFVPDTSGCSFKVYPNPALDYVILEYKMQNEDVTAVVHITDNKGRLIKTIYIDEPVGQLMVGIKELTSGLYHFTLITQRKINFAKKVTIAK